MITLCYALCGHNKHYLNLIKSLESAQRILKEPYKVLILDASKKLVKTNLNDNIEVIPFSLPYPNNIHYIWSLRYHLYKYVDTQYAIYMDSDTVWSSDTIQDLIKESEDKFLAAQHFWVPYLIDYVKYNTVSIPLDKFNLNMVHPYYASGVFFFQPKAHKIIFETFLSIFDGIFNGQDIKLEGVTDEFLLCMTAQKHSNLFKIAHGSLNHCCEKQIMPIRLNDGMIEGMNPFDSNFRAVTALHCDTFRRDPSAGYEPDLANKVRELFQI